MNFLNRVYETFNSIDTNIRKVSPIKVIKFSEGEAWGKVGKRKFFIEKSLLFDMYLRSAGYYKINNGNLIPITIDNNCKHNIIIPDNEIDAISFSNTDDIYVTHDSFFVVTNDEKNIFYVVRYMKNNLFYGMLGFTVLSVSVLMYGKFFNKK